MIKIENGNLEIRGTGAEVMADLSVILLGVHKTDPRIVSVSLKEYETLKEKSEEEMKEKLISGIVEQIMDEVFGGRK